jgi:hypothetical protein
LKLPYSSKIFDYSTIYEYKLYSPKEYFISTYDNSCHSGCKYSMSLFKWSNSCYSFSYGHFSDIREVTWVYGSRVQELDFYG